MPTGHEQLISMAGAKAVKTAAAKGSLEIDEEGLKVLSGMLEKVAAAGAEVDEDVARELEKAIEGVGTKLTKVANVNEGVKALLMKTAEVLRILKAQNSYLVDELAGMRQDEKLSKFAQELVARGICSKEELSQVIEKMQKVGNIDAVKQALEIVKPKNVLSIGAVDKQAAAAKGDLPDKYKDDPAVQFLLENPAYTG